MCGRDASVVVAVPRRVGYGASRVDDARGDAAVLGGVECFFGDLQRAAPVAQQACRVRRDLRAFGLEAQVTRALYGIGFVDERVGFGETSLPRGDSRRGHQREAPLLRYLLGSAKRNVRLEKRACVGELVEPERQRRQPDAQAAVQRR